MKYSFCMVAAWLLLLCLSTGCKKCYTCTLPNECGSCDHAGTQGAYMCSSVVPQQYAQAKNSCLANGDYWRIYSNANNVEDHCKSKPDDNWMAQQQQSCEAKGGIWQ